MRILIYGGSFNPPHLGHVSALRSAMAQLKPDRTLVIPTAEAPHKALADGSPDALTRLELAKAAFSELDGVEVSDMEIARGGKSYTSLTLDELRQELPGAELVLLVGTDMFETLEQWYDHHSIMRMAVLAPAVRRNGEREGVMAAAARYAAEYGAVTVPVDHEPIDVSSTELRALLPERRGREYLPDSVYSLIIRWRLYSARPDLNWLREKSEPYLAEKRIPHVRGCAQEARQLAQRWGEDPSLAEEAGILHDITKKLLLDEQLLLCEKYGIINDNVELASTKLLHAKTGAALSRELFGISDRVYDGIRWHTTGRANMTLFEKIIYLADYIEPTRSFDGLDRLRQLAYQDIDEAMILGLGMSLEELKQYGAHPHKNTVEALGWLQTEGRIHR